MQAFEDKGIRCTHHSLLDVRTRALNGDDLAAIYRAQRIVFTSPLTVELLAKASEPSRIDAELAAVGASTATAVRARFGRDATAPKDEQGAQALLELLSYRPVEQTVVLAAPEGLDVFVNQLGAGVRIVHTHERIPAQLSAAEIRDIESSDVVFCASGAHWRVLDSICRVRKPMVWVPSERLVSAVCAHGWQVLNTHGADDDSLLNFIARTCPFFRTSQGFAH